MFLTLGTTSQQNEKQGASSNVSNGCWNRKVIELQTTYQGPKIQRKMSNLFQKWIWMIGPRCRRKIQWYKHNHVHTNKRCTEGSNEQCHIWSIWSYVPTRKSRTKLNHPNEVTTPTAEMLIAKLLFNIDISRIGDLFLEKGYLKLLFNDTAQTSKFHPDQHSGHPWQNNQQRQSQREDYIKWVHLYLHWSRDVWITPKRASGKWASQKEIK